MGPLLINRRDVMMGHTTLEVDRLQWGRGSVSRGNGQHASGELHALAASMGPRLISRGNVLKLDPVLFVDMLQWGRSSSAAET